jgi:hypothetical protein
VGTGVRVPEFKALIDMRRVYLALSMLILTPGATVQTVALQNYETKEDKIGRACSTNGENIKEYRIFERETRRKETTRKTYT